MSGTIYTVIAFICFAALIFAYRNRLRDLVAVACIIRKGIC